MSQRVKNTTHDSDDLAGIPYGEDTRRVTYQGVEFVIGPNEQKAFADNSVAEGVDSAPDTRVSDTRDGDRHSRR